jgi:hypothetical protein
MASKIKAISAYRPRIELGNTVQKAELIRIFARATNTNESGADSVIKELRDLIIQFNREGRAVKIEGLGTFTPNIGLDGTFDLQYRADSALVNGLNDKGTFTGTIVNRENIGKTSEELVAKWNADHPEDPVTDADAPA